MRKIYIFVMVLMLASLSSFSQMSVEQVLIGNGGAFGNPEDHVNITSINPSSLNSTFVGEVFRESIQDMIISGDYAYVAAEDSIAKFDIINQEKVACIYESNLSRLYMFDNQLFVSRRSDLNGPPSDGIYLKAFDTDLNLLYAANGISADAAGILFHADSIYVAVPGDWQATEGKMAVVSMDFSFVREINLGTNAVGTYDLFSDGETIYTINKSPWGASSGSITNYSISNTDWTTNVINNVVGKGVYLIGSTLYLGLDHGIGSYNIESGLVMNNQIVPDPGSAEYIAITATAYDIINGQFYVTISDYSTFGEGEVYDLSGSLIGSFDAGISAEAIAIHYENETATNVLDDINVNIYPNPNQGILNIASNEDIHAIEIINELGQIVLSIDHPSSIKTLNLSGFQDGFYFVKVKTRESFIIKKILKR